MTTYDVPCVSNPVFWRINGCKLNACDIRAIAYTVGRRACLHTDRWQTGPSRRLPRSYKGNIAHQHYSKLSRPTAGFVVNSRFTASDRSTSVVVLAMVRREHQQFTLDKLICQRLPVNLISGVSRAANHALPAVVLSSWRPVYDPQTDTSPRRCWVTSRHRFIRQQSLSSERRLRQLFVHCVCAQWFEPNDRCPICCSMMSVSQMHRSLYA